MVGAAGLDHHGDLEQVAGRHFKEQSERNPGTGKSDALHDAQLAGVKL
jgi:hypothetical protein